MINIYNNVNLQILILFTLSFLRFEKKYKIEINIIESFMILLIMII